VIVCTVVFNREFDISIAHGPLPIISFSFNNNHSDCLCWMSS
jgi:hypothetical protein